jgi:hypothetical protein
MSELVDASDKLPRLVAYQNGAEGAFIDDCVPSDLYDKENPLKFNLPDYWLDEAIKYYAMKIRTIEQEAKRRRELDTVILESDRDVIEAIKDRTDVAEVISWYTEVKYRSGQHTFRCPFGEQATRWSGKIYDKQNWWCFHCNHGGDVFNAVQIMAKVDFPQALRVLGQFTGIAIKQKERKLKGGVAI